MFLPFFHSSLMIQIVQPPELVVVGGTGAYYRVSGTMTTAENFEETNGFIGFNARLDFCMPVTIPPTPECQDDKNWSEEIIVLNVVSGLKLLVLPVL